MKIKGFVVGLDFVVIYLCLSIQHIRKEIRNGGKTFLDTEIAQNCIDEGPYAECDESEGEWETREEGIGSPVPISKQWIHGDSASYPCEERSTLSFSPFSKPREGMLAVSVVRVNAQ